MFFGYLGGVFIYDFALAFPFVIYGSFLYILWIIQPMEEVQKIVETYDPELLAVLESVYYLAGGFLIVIGDFISTLEQYIVVFMVKTIFGSEEDEAVLVYEICIAVTEIIYDIMGAVFFQLALIGDTIEPDMYNHEPLAYPAAMIIFLASALIQIIKIGYIFAEAGTSSECV